ncbi:MAG TPA: MFS transporter, partial [Telluria sp.]
MSTSLRGRPLITLLLSASIASTIGGLPFSLLPVMLGSLADSFGLDAKAVGLIGSICFAGYLAGTLGAPAWMNRVNWRMLTLISAAGTAVSFALSASVQRLDALCVLWALIGFFASTMTCLGMRILSDLPNAERSFGVRLGVELLISAAVLFALPPLLIATWKYPGAALGVAAVIALLGVSALWVPARPLLAGAGTGASRAALPAASWFMLFVFF